MTLAFENFRCMVESEDTDEGPAYCAYPQCWLEDCPHKAARDVITPKPECDVTDCNNNVDGYCTTTLKLRRGQCQSYVVNIEKLHRQWRWQMGTVPVKPRPDWMLSDVKVTQNV